MSINPVTPTSPTPSGSINAVLSLLTNSKFLSLVVVVGLIVLMALGTLATSTGLPLVTGIGGVHLGAAVSS